jgi:hypothetical protein
MQLYFTQISTFFSYNIFFGLKNLMVSWKREINFMIAVNYAWYAVIHFVFNCSAFERTVYLRALHVKMKFPEINISLNR